MNASSRRSGSSARLSTEDRIDWTRGLLLVAALLGVVILFFVVLGLLQSVGDTKAQITSTASVPAGVRPAAQASVAASAPSVVTSSAPTGVTAVANGFPFVRSGPGQEYPVLATLQDREKVSVIGRNGDGSWLQIMLPSGQRGWSGTNLLVVSGNANTVPVTQ